MRGPGCPPQAGTSSGCVPRFIIVNATVRPPESSTARSIRVTSDVRGPVPSAQAARATHIAAAKPRVLYLISPPGTPCTTSHVTGSGRQLQGWRAKRCSANSWSSVNKASSLLRSLSDSSGLSKSTVKSTVVFVPRAFSNSEKINPAASPRVSSPARKRRAIGPTSGFFVAIEGIRLTNRAYAAAPSWNVHKQNLEGSQWRLVLQQEYSERFSSCLRDYLYLGGSERFSRLTAALSLTPECPPRTQPAR